MKFAIGTTLLHIGMAGLSLWFAARSGIYPPHRLKLQALLALFVPFVGPLWVFWMLRESHQETPRPTTNQWVRMENNDPS